MEPFPNAAEVEPVVYYILPPPAEDEIGPGDLEIEFEPEWEADDE